MDQEQTLSASRFQLSAFPPADPMAALREILDAAGPDVAALFGPALTIFAGARSSQKEPKEKAAELERLILNPRPGERS